MSQDIVDATNSEVAHVRNRSLHRRCSRPETAQPDRARPDAQGSRAWIYKMLKRFQAGGYAAVTPRSRRPRSCSCQVDAKVQKLIVRLRCNLAAASHDAGPQTIHYHLTHRAEDESAASGRDAMHALNLNAAWPEGGPHHPRCRLVPRILTAMDPHASGGVYVNFLHNDEGEARVHAAYGNKYERFARIKALYNPDNIFRSNQNIRPAGNAAG